jgi:DUF971 family protein
MTEVHQPKDIALDKKAHVLRLLWDDGHEAVFPLDQLREACPCAVCRGGHEFMGPEHDPDIIELKPARSYAVMSMGLTGNYALQITWDDGHSSGIYSWGYLRRLLPPSDEAGSS